MLENEQSGYTSIMRSKLIFRVSLVLCVMVIGYTFWEFIYKVQILKQPGIVDFHLFYVVGKLVWNGSVDKAYYFKDMLEIQEEYLNAQSFMPWAYPPQFNFIVAVLPLLPLGISYFVFILLSFVCYICILRCLSGPYMSVVLLSIAPAMFVNIRCGQNGFIIAALVGLFFLSVLRGRQSYAGISLGFIIIKPHFAVIMTMLSIIMRYWRTVVMAAMVVVLTSLIVTVYFGQTIWIAFINGAREASKFLELGAYPLNRMTSVYAVLRSFGMPAQISMLMQIVVALTSCYLIIYAWRHNWKRHRILGIAALASLYISPYCYDYDMNILGIAVAFLAQDISVYTNNKEKLILLVLSWIGCGWGILMTIINSKSIFTSSLGNNTMSLAGISLLILLFCFFYITKRSESLDKRKSYC